MIDFNNATALNSDRVNEATEALAIGRERLETIGQLLCLTDCLHLEKRGLEGFRNMLAECEVDIENALEALGFPQPVKDDEDDEEPVTAVIERQAMNQAFFKELMSNPDATVREALPRANSAFNRYVSDEYKKNGLDPDEAPVFWTTYPSIYEDPKVEAKGDSKFLSSKEKAPVTDYGAVPGRDC